MTLRVWTAGTVGGRVASERYLAYGAIIPPSPYPELGLMHAGPDLDQIQFR